MADVIRPGRRRFWLLPLIAAVVLAAAPRGARNPAPPPKPQAESYPATRFGTQVLGTQRDYLDLLSPMPMQGTFPLLLWRRWYESAPHPYLASVLPGVRFFLVEKQHNVVPALYPNYDPTALLNGRLYGLRQLSRLLLDAGFPFDSASAPTAAKIAVLFSLLGDQFTYTLTPRPQLDWRKYRAPDNPDSAQAFPEVEFRRVEVGYMTETTTVQELGKEPRKAEYNRPGVWVECTIYGREQRLFVKFIQVGADREWQVDMLGFSGGALVRFDWFIPPRRSR